jgi:hypothetical protein
MKKVFLTGMLLFMGVACFSQKKNLPKYSKDYFLQKSKSKKQTAWILLGGGTAAVIGGAIGFANTFEINLWSDENSNNNDNANGFFGALLIAGIVSDLASIPFFISSHNYKRMAAEVTLSNQRIYLPKTTNTTFNTLPSVTLRVKF